MTKRLEIYKCEVCGNIVEVLHAAGGTLVCCGKPMVLQVAKTEEEGKEKHLPVIEKTGTGVKVKVGSVAHPMEEKHYLEWISVTSGNEIMRKFLSPGEAPEAKFPRSDVERAREYCNVHGNWATK